MSYGVSLYRYSSISLYEARRLPISGKRRPRHIKPSVLREGEREQRAALAGPELSGQEPLEPGAPAVRHRDELASVNLVRGRAAVVAAAPPELPHQVSPPPVERAELT